MNNIYKPYFLLFFLLLTQHFSFSQLREGFDSFEVKTLVSLCNSYTFDDLYGSDEEIIPKNCEKVYTSDVIGMDNKFQVYKSGNLGIINFRGSTEKISSWMENMYSAMIPAKGTITINEDPFKYTFAEDTAAAVHSGYALAISLLSPHIIEQIKELNKDSIYDILITGHSQGGAIAHLTTAYLQNLSTEVLSAKNTYKTYAFANPMCGNREFATEYNTKYSDRNMSFSIINPADAVPNLPMHYQEEGKVFTKKLFADILLGNEGVDLRQMGMDLVIRSVEKSLTNYIKFSNGFIEKIISKTHVPIDMPDYKHDINYFQVGNITYLKPFTTYPKIKIDTSQLSDFQIWRLTPALDGNYYEKEPSFFQHKPYNYYVEILREYFSYDFNNLEKKYLRENL